MAYAVNNMAFAAIEICDAAYAMWFESKRGNNAATAVPGPRRMPVDRARAQLGRRRRTLPQRLPDPRRRAGRERVPPGRPDSPGRARHRHRRQQYVLLAGVNDTLEDADRLVAWLAASLPSAAAAAATCRGRVGSW